ncbi:MAG: DUF4242 domain-containing protein, partial [Ignavibacteriaceae bacterium]
AQTQDNKTENTVMKRYVVERSFPEGLDIPVNEKGCEIVLGVISNNTEEHVTWIHSYVSADKKKTFCIYEAPSKEAIRKAAVKNGIAVDKITEVSVLNPYFYTNNQ